MPKKSKNRYWAYVVVFRRVQITTEDFEVAVKGDWAPLSRRFSKKPGVQWAHVVDIFEEA